MLYVTLKRLNSPYLFKTMLVYFVGQSEAKKFFFAQIRNERIEGIPVKKTANNGFFQSL